MNVPHNLVIIDINEIKPALVEYIQNEADNGVRVLDVMFLAQGRVIALESGYSATATVSVNDVLITDDLSCTVDTANNLVKAEIDCKRLQIAGAGVMKVQITVTDGTNILISPQPVLIRLTSDLAQTAQILPDSHSSYSEIVAEIVAARGDYDNLAQALSHLMGFLSSATVDNATETGKVYYTTVGSSKALIVPVSGESSQAQFRLDRDGKIYSRRREKQNGAFLPWGNTWTDLSAAIDPDIVQQIVETYIAEHGIDLTGVERTANRVEEINAQSDNSHYPTAGAVYHAVNASYNILHDAIMTDRGNISNLESDKASRSEVYTKSEVDTALSNKANKSTTLAGYGITDAYIKLDINQMFNQVDVDLQGKEDTANKTTSVGSGSSHTQYPSSKAVYDYVTTAISGKEDTANKVTSISSNSTDTQYPSAKAVYTTVSTVANNSEAKANKVTSISSNSTNTQYPSALAVYNAIQNAIGGIENGSY